MTERPSITLPLCVLGAGVVHGLCIATLLPHLVVLPTDPSPDDRIAVVAASSPPSADEPLLRVAAKQSDPFTTASLGKIARPDLQSEAKDERASTLPEPVAALAISEPLGATQLASLAPVETIGQSSAPESVTAALPPLTVEARDVPGEAVAAIDGRLPEAAAPRKAHAAKPPPVQTRAATKRREPAVKQRTAIAPRSTRPPTTVRRPIAQQPNRGTGRGPFGFLFGKPAGAGQNTNKR